MKNTLKIVYRAVDKKGGIFSNIRIDDGVVEANNGRVSIRASVPELAGITATVPGAKLLAAVNACKGEIKIHTTEANLMIKSGSFSARIPLNRTEFPTMEYGDGDQIEPAPDFPRKLGIASSFASEMFNGVLLRGDGIYGVSDSAFIAIDSHGGAPRDSVIPLATVADIVAIKEQPSALHVAENHATLTYDNFDLRTQTVDKKWPDVAPFLGFGASVVPERTDDLLEAVRSVLPFAGQIGRVAFSNGSVTAGEASVAGIDMHDGAFQGGTLEKALSLSTQFEVYEEDDRVYARFAGDGLRGVLAGVK